MIKINEIKLYYLKNQQELEIADQKEKLKKNKKVAHLSYRVESIIRCVNCALKHHIRGLEEVVVLEPIRSVNDRYKGRYIALDDSDLTRTLQMEDGVNNQLIQVVASNKSDRNIAQDIVYNGFDYNGSHYVYLFSSAGMTRDCKLLFIQEGLLEQIQDKLYCGLSKEVINAKGGINVNKFLAYLSLCKTSSRIWNGFDIDRAIVIDDFETMVQGEFDCVDTDTGSITREFREVEYIATDGFGVVQTDTRKKLYKNFQFRLPWFKGLLSEFDIKGYITEHGLNPVVTDIWDKKWNLIDDNIQYIFTKSQFKMWSYYDSWDEYKKYFKQYNCNANICKDDSTVNKKASLNYQVLQDLSVSDDELNNLLSKDLKRLKSAHTVEKEALKLITQDSFGSIGEAYEIYPEMLHSGRVHKLLNRIIESKKMDLALGGISIDGSYLYVIPDITACLEHWCGAEPKGILSQGNCYTSVFKEHDVVLERSPHLSKEHVISNNDYNNKDCQRWFKTNGIYISIYDSYYKLLQYDNDGDEILTIFDKTFYNIAKRTMEDVVPLHYEMPKAPKEIISNETIFNSLKKSWSINIGMCSNKITKFVNSLESDITKEEYKTVQLYTCYNNFLIDYAKSGYMPPFIKTLPKIDNSSMPYFFKYKKDYNKAYEEEPNNYSVMDRIASIVFDDSTRTEYNFPFSENFKFENLLSVKRLGSKKIGIKKELIKRYKVLSREKNPSDDIATRAIWYEGLRSRLLDGLDITIQEALCILARFIYNTKSGLDYSEIFLWNCFGKELLENLEKSLDGTKVCACCKSRFKPNRNVQKYCSEECKKKSKKH